MKLIDPKLRKTDWDASGETGIQYEDRGVEWGEYLPIPENQYQPKDPKSLYSVFDTSGCTCFSHTNTLEIQGNYLFDTGKLSQTTIDILTDLKILKDGQFNFSDRWLYHVSGTTKDGNSIITVADAARKYGLIAEEYWPFSGDLKTLEEYAKNPPEELYALGKRFLEVMDISYEWVIAPGNTLTPEEKYDLIQKHVKQSPLQIGVYVCDGWSRFTATESKTIKGCDPNLTGHAVVEYNVSSQEALHLIFDHYTPFKKRLAKDYPIKYVLKILLTEKTKVQPIRPQYYFAVDLKYGDRSEEVKKLQEWLIWADCLKAGMNTGYFGENTRIALLKWQEINGVTSWWENLWYRGKYFGPKTRKAINILMAG